MVLLLLAQNKYFLFNVVDIVYITIDIFIDFFFKREKRREGEKERKIDLLFHLLMHLLVYSILICALTRDQTATLVYWDNTLTN